MGQRWSISDARWDSRLSLRLLRLVLLGVWSGFVFVWGLVAMRYGILNKGTITRTGTPYVFWMIICLVFAAAAVMFVYNVYLFVRGRGRRSEAV